MATRQLLWALAVIGIAISLVTDPAYPADVANDGDIVCSRTQHRFLLRSDCSQVCRDGLKLGFCQIAPESPGLVRAAPVGPNGGNWVAQLYDNSVRSTDVPCGFLDTLFTPYTCGSFSPVYVLPPGPVAAQHVCAKVGKNTVGFNVDLAKEHSPAYVALVVGHEMVHADACARDRHNNIDLTGLENLHNSFNELEAYSWMVGADQFTRTFKVKASELNLLTSEEKSHIAARLACSSWQVDWNLARAIAHGVPTDVRRYVTTDAWIKSVWLPNHPHWDKQGLPRKQPTARCDENPEE